MRNRNLFSRNVRNPFIRDGRRRLAKQAKPDVPSLLPQSRLAAGFICSLIIADLFTLKTLFNTTFTENPLIIWLLSIAAAIILDASMSVAGVCVSQCAKGQRGKTETICITAGCVAAFLLTLYLCTDLRMTTREFTLTGIGAAQGGLVDLLGAGGGESPDTGSAVLSAARLLSFLPVATSILAFALSFALSDPVSEKTGRLQERRRALQDMIAGTEALLAECDDAEEETRLQVLQEEELYRAFLALIDDQALQAKQRARILIMEKAKTPEAITRLTEGAAALDKTALPETRTVPRLAENND